MIYGNNLKYCLFCFIRFIRLITQRSEVRILSPLPKNYKGLAKAANPFFAFWGDFSNGFLTDAAKTLSASSLRRVPVDTGFIVLNDRTYPLLMRFLAGLQVPIRKSDMSFSYTCRRTRLQYASRNCSSLKGISQKAFRRSPP